MGILIDEIAPGSAPKFPGWVKKLNFKLPGMSFFSVHHVMSYFSHRSFNVGEFNLIIAFCKYSTWSARNIKKTFWYSIFIINMGSIDFYGRKIYKDRFGWKYPVLYFATKGWTNLLKKKCKAVITSGKYHHKHIGGLT